MSHDNVEIARNMHTAFGRRDLEALLAACHPEVTYRAAITQLLEGEAGDFRGHDGIRRWWRDLDDLYDDLRTEVVEVCDLDGERVLVVFDVHGRGKGSGVTRVERLTQVATVRDGQIIEMRDFFSRREALEAVGLRD